MLLEDFSKKLASTARAVRLCQQQQLLYSISGMDTAHHREGWRQEQPGRTARCMRVQHMRERRILCDGASPAVLCYASDISVAAASLLRVTATHDFHNSFHFFPGRAVNAVYLLSFVNTNVLHELTSCP